MHAIKSALLGQGLVIEIEMVFLAEKSISSISVKNAIGALVNLSTIIEYLTLVLEDKKCGIFFPIYLNELLTIDYCFMMPPNDCLLFQLVVLY